MTTPTQPQLSPLEQQWLQHHQQWLTSKLTRQQYAEQQQLNPHGFNSACRRLRAKGILPATKQKESVKKNSHFHQLTLQPAFRITRIGLPHGGWIEPEQPLAPEQVIELLRQLA